MNIFDNKPIVIPTWELKLVVDMGTWGGIDLIPDNTITPFDFEVWFNDTKLDLPTVIGEHRFNIEDTTMPTDHELKMIVSNARWQHLIRCCVFVEDLDIGYIIENTGSYYTENVNYVKSDYGGTDILLGVDGYQTIPIQTPIYKWLLDNKKNVLSKLVSK